MNVKFKLKEPNSTSSTLILLKAYINGQRLTYSTSYKIEPKYWNDKKMRTKKVRGYSDDYANLDIWLENLETELKKTVLNIRSQGRIPLVSEMKDSLDYYTNKKEKSQSATLFEFIRSFIVERKRSPNYSQGTTKNYVTHFNNLQEFVKVRGQEFDYEDINLDFYLELMSFYTSKGDSQNYKHKQIQTLKVILNEAFERGLTKNQNHTKKWFNVKKEAVQNFSLEYKDLMKLFDFDLSEDLRLERVRDLFLIGSFTGLRFSDFSVLKSSNIKTKDDNRQYLIVKTLKTKDSLEIPLNPQVISILDRYGMKPPRGMSNQKMNMYLKELFKKVGINRKVTISKYNNQGVMYEASEPICDIISTHTARRSFATIAYKMGVNSIDIMQITGHKKETTFLKYINITKEDTAKRIALNPFFSLDTRQQPTTKV